MFSVESILFNEHKRKPSFVNTMEDLYSNTRELTGIEYDNICYEYQKSIEELELYDTYNKINTYNTIQKLRMLKRIRSVTRNIHDRNINNSCESYLRSLEDGEEKKKEESGEKKKNIIVRFFDWIIGLLKRLRDFIVRIFKKFVAFFTGKKEEEKKESDSVNIRETDPEMKKYIESLKDVKKFTPEEKEKIQAIVDKYGGLIVIERAGTSLIESDLRINKYTTKAEEAYKLIENDFKPDLFDEKNLSKRSAFANNLKKIHDDLFVHFNALKQYVKNGTSNKIAKSTTILFSRDLEKGDTGPFKLVDNFNTVEVIFDKTIGIDTKADNIVKLTHMLLPMQSRNIIDSITKTNEKVKKYINFVEAIADKVKKMIKQTPGYTSFLHPSVNSPNGDTKRGYAGEGNPTGDIWDCAEKIKKLTKDQSQISTIYANSVGTFLRYIMDVEKVFGTKINKIKKLTLGFKKW